MLRFSDLSKGFSTKVLFDKVNLDLPQSAKIALVGANGSGKTTLLNIITGTEMADSGTVIRTNKARVGYLPQVPNSTPRATVLAECVAGAQKLDAQKMQLAQLVERLDRGQHDEELLHEFEALQNEFRREGGYAIEARASEILVGLGMDRQMFDKNPTELSGGFRMRLELAKIFLNDPEVLILDEPTNHLDLPALAWTENFLRTYKGTLLFVSHDRVLLNRLANYTLYLSNGKLALYHGNFDAFLEQRERDLEQNRAALEKLTARRKQYERFVERFGAKATKAAQARSRVKMIEKLQVLADSIEIEDEGDQMALSFVSPLPSGRTVIEMNRLAIGYETPLIGNLNLKVERGQRIAIVGANGIGKSTLIKTLASCIPSLGGSFTLGHNVKCAYFAQDPMELFDVSQDLLSQIMASDTNLGQKAARSLLGAFLFRADEVFKKPTVLSGGEKNRLGMAILLARRANLLLLDEPTNHLDMQSVEVLIEALSRYEGTILFVSHNRDFIDALCTHVLVMLADGRYGLFHGQLADYEEMAAQSGFPNVLAASDKDSLPSSRGVRTDSIAGENSKVDHAQAKQLKTERSRLKKQIERLEAMQEELRQKISLLQGAMEETNHSEYQKFRSLQDEISQNENQLVEAENEWLIASESLEEIDRELAALGRQG